MHRGRFIVHLRAVAIVMVVTYLHPRYSVPCISMSSAVTQSYLLFLTSNSLQHTKTFSSYIMGLLYQSYHRQYQLPQKISLSIIEAGFLYKLDGILSPNSVRA